MIMRLTLKQRGIFNNKVLCNPQLLYQIVWTFSLQLRNHLIALWEESNHLMSNRLRIYNMIVTLLRSKSL